MKRVLVGILSGLVLNGCTMIDDYMLGKENSPEPAQLTEVPSKIKITKRWDANISARSLRESEFYKLKPTINKNIIYSASASGFVQAREVKTGKLLWSSDTKIDLSSGPKIERDIIVVGSTGAVVIALSAKDGKKLWQSEVSNQLLAAPVIKDGQVYAKTIDGQLYAFSAYSGKQLWHYNHGAPKLILRASSDPVVYSNLVLSGFADGKLDAINTSTGRVEWQRDVSQAQGSSDVERLIDIDASPIIRGDVVYVVSYQGDVSAISATSGRVLWQHKMSAYRDMAIDKNRLYIVDAQSHVWALNRHNGMVLWQQKKLHNRNLNPPAVSSLGLVLTDGYGYMHIMSPTTGEIIGRNVIGGVETDVAPVIYGKEVFVLFENGLLTDYRLAVS